MLAGVRKLLACPFCRSLHAEGETDGTCPDCGVGLQPMEKLPPSLEVESEEIASGQWVPPEDRTLPWWYAGRGRGPLLVLAAIGIALFFAPWVELTRPDLVSLRGFDLARGRAGWLWGGAVGWFVLVPLVASRRNIVAMRGVRIVTAVLAAMTLGEVVTMVALPPSSSGVVPVSFSWGWGLYGSGVVSAVATVVGARFGGSIDDLPTPFGGAAGSNSAGAPPGEMLH